MSTSRPRPRPQRAPLVRFPPEFDVSSKPLPPFSPQRRQQSTLSKIFNLIPLVLVLLILAFGFYGFFISLVLWHQLYLKQDYLRALIEGLVFLLLWGGCTGSVLHANIRGPGFVSRVAKPSQLESGQHLAEEEENLSDEPDYDDPSESKGLLENSEFKLMKVRKVPVSSSSKLRGSSKQGDNGRGMGLQDALNDLEAFAEVRSKQFASVQSKGDGKPRFCRKCVCEKPDRAHHCSACEECVLKFDHHCPVISTCVGWANYKFFLLFLLYAALLGTYVGAVTFYELYEYIENEKDAYLNTPLSWAFVSILGIVIGIACWLFGLYHLYLACSNRTTIENLERPSTLAPTAGSAEYRPDHELSFSEVRKLNKISQKYNLYDVGWRKNLSQIFGGRDQAHLWLLPWGWPPGNGTYFAINESNLEKVRRITRQIKEGINSDDSDSV